jgi:flavin-dependent dehydrogenase
MASFDCDVVIIGSGFGGSVAALRAATTGSFRSREPTVLPSGNWP